MSLIRIEADEETLDGEADRLLYAGGAPHMRYEGQAVDDPNWYHNVVMSTKLGAEGELNTSLLLLWWSCVITSGICTVSIDTNVFARIN